ncbi:protein kinase [Streptomyces lasalocidi]
MDDYAGRVLADRYRLPLPPSDEYELTETRAFDTYSGQEVLVRQVPLPEVVEAEVLDAEGLPEGFTARERGARRAADARTATRRPADPAVRRAVEAAQAAARIPDHPRLDQVFDVFAEGGSLWIVSEWVAARPLSAFLAEQPLSPYRAAEVASDVLMALRVLHAHGWVHRNITARTVLVCDDGRVMLTGLAVGAAEEALSGYDPVPGQDGVPGQERVEPGTGAASTDGGGGAAASSGGPVGGVPSADVDPETARRAAIQARAAGGLLAAEGTSGGADTAGPPALESGASGTDGASGASGADIRAARAGAIAAYRAGARAAARVQESRQADRPALPGARPPADATTAYGADSGRQVRDPSAHGADFGRQVRDPSAHGADFGRQVRDPSAHGADFGRQARDLSAQGVDVTRRAPDSSVYGADFGRQARDLSDRGADLPRQAPDSSVHGAGSGGRGRGCPLMGLSRVGRPGTCPLCLSGLRGDRECPGGREGAAGADDGGRAGDRAVGAGAGRARARELAAGGAGRARDRSVGARGVAVPGGAGACAVPGGVDGRAGAARVRRAARLRRGVRPAAAGRGVAAPAGSDRAARRRGTGRLAAVVGAVRARARRRYARGDRASQRPGSGCRSSGAGASWCGCGSRRDRTAETSPHGRHKRSPERSRGEARSPRSLGRTLLVLILLLLAGAIAFAMLFLPKQGHDGAAGGDRTGSVGQTGPAPSRTPQPSSGQSADGGPSASAPGTETQTGGDPSVSAGFTLRTDPGGFKIAVAKGWGRTPKNGSGEVVYAQGNFELIVVPGRDSAAGYGSDPMAYQRDKESELQPYRDSSWATATGLRTIEVGGRTMAEGQFTWTDGQGRDLFVRNMAILLNGRYHVIQVRGPESERDQVTRLYEQATATYTYTG